MNSNEKLIQCIFDELRDDDEPAEKKGDRLKRTYNEASQEKKQIIDDLLITLTGWSFPTLLKKSIEEY